jgi:exopolyphosphatase / guanosine-5'-triphosphate,3'-diphosphate pyrophosphatase
VKADGPVRVAAVDCGTNALRMLVLQDAGEGGAIEVVRRLRLVRLGEGVDSTGEFTPAALARTFTALDEYARELTELKVQRVRLVATSAARDAGNVTEFLAGVHARLGVDGEIISGAEEARLCFMGALSGLAAPSEPVLVTDIGGGSTELVVGTRHGVQRAVSLDIGSVRLRERFLADDPPSAAQLGAAAAYIDSQLAGADIDLASTRGWIGVAGTVTTMAALSEGLVSYDRSVVQGARLDRAAIDAVTDLLCRTCVADLLSELLPPLRAEVIAAGALICARIAARVGAPEMIVSETDILDGVARELLNDATNGVGFVLHKPP